MNRILLTDTPLFSVWVYPERKIIHHATKKYCYGDDYREGLTKGLEAMKAYKATKWLTDNSRSTGALLREDEEWSFNVWLPSARALGWKHWSIVQPGGKIAQLTVERAIRNLTQLGINARMFSDPDEAMKWLDEA